jgi:hypothetical protein
MLFGNILKFCHFGVKLDHFGVNCGGPQITPFYGHFPRVGDQANSATKESW